MNNFSKFCYGVRALGFGALALMGTYKVAEETGLVDGIKRQVNNIKNKKRNKEMQKVLDRSRYETNDVIKEAAAKTFYAECFRDIN